MRISFVIQNIQNVYIEWKFPNMRVLIDANYQIVCIVLAVVEAHKQKPFARFKLYA